MRTRLSLALCALFAFASGCQPAIGDSCNSSIDCSANNTRICDTASENGYCTIRGCDPDGCPNGALCVEWLGDQPRTAETWCMAKCSNNGDCRQGAGYTCVHEGDDALLSEEGVTLARITDLDGRREKGFCAQVTSESP